MKNTLKLLSMALFLVGSIACLPQSPIGNGSSNTLSLMMAPPSVDNLKAAYGPNCTDGLNATRLKEIFTSAQVAVSGDSLCDGLRSIMNLYSLEISDETGTSIVSEINKTLGTENLTITANVMRDKTYKVKLSFSWDKIKEGALFSGETTATTSADKITNDKMAISIELFPTYEAAKLGIDPDKSVETPKAIDLNIETTFGSNQNTQPQDSEITNKLSYTAINKTLDLVYKNKSLEFVNLIENGSTYSSWMKNETLRSIGSKTSGIMVEISFEKSSTEVTITACNATTCFSPIKAPLTIP